MSSFAEKVDIYVINRQLWNVLNQISITQDQGSREPGRAPSVGAIRGCGGGDMEYPQPKGRSGGPSLEIFNI